MTGGRQNGVEQDSGCDGQEVIGQGWGRQEGIGQGCGRQEVIGQGWD